MSSVYTKYKCPKCKAVRSIVRRSSSLGKIVSTYCSRCDKMVPVKVKRGEG